MRVLFIGTNYAPEETGISPFTTGLAEHLASRGDDVVVCTALPHYPEWKVAPQYRGYQWVIEDREGVEVRRSAVFIPKRRSVPGRVLYDSSFALCALLTALPTRRPDVIIAVSPPVQAGHAGGLLARRWGVPMILLIKDLPLSAAISVGMMKPGIATRVGLAIERSAYRLAQRVVIISDVFAETMAENGIPWERLVRIPDWADTDAIAPSKVNLRARGLLGANGHDFLVVHAGNMGEKQGLGSAVRAAQEASAAGAFKLALIGDGFARASLEAMIAASPDGAVKMLPLQPREELPKMLNAADALLLNQRGDVTDAVVPSKLLTYMAAGRPVLAAVNAASAAARLVEDAKCGIVVLPDNPQALVDGVRRMRRDPSARETLGRSGREFVKRNYSRQSALTKWDELLDDVVKPDPPHGTTRGTHNPT